MIISLSRKEKKKPCEANKPKWEVGREGVKEREETERKRERVASVSTDHLMTELNKKATPTRKMTPYLRRHTILCVQISLPLTSTLTHTRGTYKKKLHVGKPGMWVTLIHFNQEHTSAKSALTGPSELGQSRQLQELNRSAYSGHLRVNVSGAYTTQIPVRVLVGVCSCRGRGEARVRADASRSCKGKSNLSLSCVNSLKNSNPEGNKWSFDAL